MKTFAIVARCVKLRINFFYYYECSEMYLRRLISYNSSLNGAAAFSFFCFYLCFYFVTRQSRRDSYNRVTHTYS